MKFTTLSLQILSCACFLSIQSCKDSEAIKTQLANPLAGGEGTVYSNTHDAFSLPSKNITAKHRVDFVVGNAFFKENWVPSPSSVKSRQGLGPLFNAQSCSSCHFKDGRAAPPLSGDEIPVGLLLRMSLPGKDPTTGNVVPVPFYGDQLQHQAIMGVRSEASFFADSETISGTYPDGTAYSLQKPKFRFSNQKFGPWPKETLFSPRVAPQLIGVGLLEAIPESEILKNEDPLDADKDGISGHANRVWDYEHGVKKIGRFGWKANQPSLRQQNSGAFLGDMGITSPVFPNQNCDPKDKECTGAHSLRVPEISEENLIKLTNYTKNLAVPAKRNLDDKAVFSGAGAFYQIGCNKCHVASYQTGVDPEFPENSKQVIFPFTDLLLHDMGEGLADGRPDFEASGTEWRTPPLWGLGLVKAVNGHTRFLHDGRARNFEEAILWHGGEAQASQEQFKKLSKSQRQDLIKFLESL